MNPLICCESFRVHQYPHRYCDHDTFLEEKRWNIFIVASSSNKSRIIEPCRIIVPFCCRSFSFLAPKITSYSPQNGAWESWESWERLRKISRFSTLQQRFSRLRISQGTCQKHTHSFSSVELIFSKYFIFSQGTKDIFSRYQMVPRKTRESLQKMVMLWLDCFLTLNY